MKHLIQRLKRAWEAFKGKDEPKVEETKSIAPGVVLERPGVKIIQIGREEFEKMQVVAQETARKAHIEQNKLMDDYFNAILAKNVDPFIVELYKSDKKPIPYLNTHIHQDADPFRGMFSRRMEISIGVKKIGDAVFTAKIQNGEIEQMVEEKIPR